MKQDVLFSRRREPLGGGCPPKGGVGENPFPPSERLHDKALDNRNVKATFPLSLIICAVRPLALAMGI